MNLRRISQESHKNLTRIHDALEAVKHSLKIVKKKEVC